MVDFIDEERLDEVISYTAGTIATILSKSLQDLVYREISSLMSGYEMQNIFIGQYKDGLKIACTDFIYQFSDNGNYCYHDFEQLLLGFIANRHRGELRPFINILREYADRAEAALNDTH